MGTSYEIKHECATMNYKHQNEYPWFITALKHWYRCFISIIKRVYLLNVMH